MKNLNIYLKDGNVFQFCLTEEKISVRRSSDNDIHLQDAFCSGHHAFFYADDQGYVVRDNNSKNGTFLNGKRIPGDVELKNGDEILIGTTRIVYARKSIQNIN